MVGNKIDLGGVRKVTTEQAKAFADANKMEYIETSALESTNVQTSFELLISQIYYRTIAHNSNQTDHTSITANGHSAGQRLDREDENNESTFSCC